MFGVRMLQPALGSLALLTCCCVVRAADDPVMDLRKALSAPLRSSDDPNDVARELQAREKALLRRIDAITNVADLGQALLLQEWNVEDKGGEGFNRIKERMRIRVVQKFEAGARQVFRGPSARAKEAVARLIGDIGNEVRSVEIGGRLLRTFTPDLAALMDERDEGVRVAAADALGRINPEPELALAALSRALQGDTTSVRRAAAAAFASIVKRDTQLAKTQVAAGGGPNRRNYFRAIFSGYMGVGSDPFSNLTHLSRFSADVGEIPFAEQVVPIVARGAGDADVQVRRSSIDALTQLANALAEMVADPRPRDEFQTDEDFKAEVDLERVEMMPLARAFLKQYEALGAALRDPDARARQDACNTMVELGIARVKMQRRVASIPPYTSNRIPDAQDPLLDLFKSVLVQLDAAAADPVMEVRRHAIEATETLGADGLLALSTLERGLRDPDRFVRWVSIRALGRFTPEQGEKVVPALIPSLREPDIDLRMMTAASLERYGPRARAALPELRRAVLVGDLDMRKAAISAILAMGTDIAREAIPTLIAAVEDPRSSIRRGAAEALAQFGPDARDAIPALTKLEESDDPDDRKAATYAILKILTK